MLNPNWSQVSINNLLLKIKTAFRPTWLLAVAVATITALILARPSDVSKGATISVLSMKSYIRIVSDLEGVSLSWTFQLLATLVRHVLQLDSWASKVSQKLRRHGLPDSCSGSAEPSWSRLCEGSWLSFLYQGARWVTVQDWRARDAESLLAL